MSNENNSRPAGRDELDIDRLIRSIRSTEPEPEQPEPRKSAPIRKEPVPAPKASTAQGAEEEELPLHLAQPERPLTRQER